MTKDTKISFDLFENGLDFIENSIKPILDSKNELDLKYSVLHISAGVELILKEILRNEHWSLIFENIDKANYNKLLSGDFQSVSFETILIRLKNIAKVEITDSAIKYIRELRKKRNKIEHFAFDDNVFAIKSIVSKALSYILEIIKENVDLEPYSVKAQELHRSILRKSSEFDEFISLTYSKLKIPLEIINNKGIRLIQCPECFHHTLPIDDTLQCLLCGYSDEPEHVAYVYIENVLGLVDWIEPKDGEYFPLEKCIECKTKTLFIGKGVNFCFSCKNEWKQA